MAAKEGRQTINSIMITGSLSQTAAKMEILTKQSELPRKEDPNLLKHRGQPGPIRSDQLGEMPETAGKANRASQPAPSAPGKWLKEKPAGPILN